MIHGNFNNFRSSLRLCQMLHNLLLMKPHVLAARVIAALTAFQIVGGIDSPALGAGVLFDLFGIPGLKPDFLSAGMRFPQLDPVRHQYLKFLQVLAGIVRAFSAELHAFSRSAFCHRAPGLAKKAPLCGPAAVALHFLKGPLKALGHHREFGRLFVSPDEDVARGTEEPANGSKFFICDIRHCFPPLV